jgi:hypothetical protein
MILIYISISVHATRNPNNSEPGQRRTIEDLAKWELWKCGGKKKKEAQAPHAATGQAQAPGCDPKGQHPNSNRFGMEQFLFVTYNFYLLSSTLLSLLSKNNKQTIDY